MIFLPRHAEIWNPKTQAFRKVAAETVPRLYHSTSLLLPDGTVLVGGGGTPGPLNNTNGQIYRPPYLFTASGEAAPRPAWENVPKRMGYDQQIVTSLSSAETISKVTLLKLGSVTHSFDFDQRFRELSFKQNGKELTINSPKQRTLAPPGYYMLFAVNYLYL